MLTVEATRALITTSLTDDQLEDVIAREESWLANRIGTLEGERTETFDPDAGDSILLLRRRAVTVTVTDDNGDVSSIVVQGWSDVIRTDDVSWDGDPEVVYTPDDSAAVENALITCVRLRIAESAYASESSGPYAYSYDHAAARHARWAAWRSLLRPPATGAIPVVASVTARVLPYAVAVAGS